MFMLNERSLQLFRNGPISAHVLNTKAYQNGIGWQLFLALSETFIEILDNLFDRAAYWLGFESAQSHIEVHLRLISTTALCIGTSSELKIKRRRRFPKADFSCDPAIRKSGLRVRILRTMNGWPLSVKNPVPKPVALKRWNTASDQVNRGA